MDGTLGSSTLEALRLLPLDEVYRRYKEGRVAYYTSLGERFPDFLQGWLRRANSFPDLCQAA